MMIKHGLSQKYNDGLDLRTLSVYDYLCHAFQKKNQIILIKYEKAKTSFFVPDSSLKIVFRILGRERFLSMIKNVFNQQPKCLTVLCIKIVKTRHLLSLF